MSLGYPHQTNSSCYQNTTPYNTYFNMPVVAGHPVGFGQVSRCGSAVVPCLKKLALRYVRTVQLPASGGIHIPQSPKLCNETEECKFGCWLDSHFEQLAKSPRSSGERSAQLSCAFQTGQNDKKLLYSSFSWSFLCYTHCETQ